MRREKQRDTRINSILFDSLFKEWWVKNCKEALIADAEEAFSKLIVANGGTVVVPSTVHSWRFKSVQIGEPNLHAIQRLLGKSVALAEQCLEESTNALSANGTIALMVYGHFARFLEGISFASLDEIEEMYYELTLALSCLRPFASTFLQEVIDQAVRDIALPLTDERTHEPKHVAAIGHYTEQGCFHIDDFAGFAASQADILRPFHAHLQELAEKLRTFL